MFNLLVVGAGASSTHGSLSLRMERVFVHTDDELSSRFKPNGVLDKVALMALPTIFAEETSTDPEKPSIAHVGAVTGVRTVGRDYEIQYTLDVDVPPIPNAILEGLSGELNFVRNNRGFGDFSTNHWAVKDRDLFKVLYKHGIGRVSPTVFALSAEPISVGLVSVMMPFDAGFNGVYAALQAAATAAGMRCQRADDIWDEDVLINDVAKLISTAQVVICDLTNKNANVFYETGIAHTLGKDVILLARHETDVPFDLRHIRHVRYQSNDQGLGELTERVTARLQKLSRG